MLPESSAKVLVIGGGGREHALCWKLAQSNRVEKILCAPGNGGTQTCPKVTNVDAAVSDFEKLAGICRDEKIDLVVVGPDNPLADGVVDFLQERGVRVFGPTKSGARIEWSKSYAKQFMQDHGIPTARYCVADNLSDGLKLAEENSWANVVKVDGLALGKGVFVCDSVLEVKQALGTIFEMRAFGDAGATVLLEERLSGEEMSLLFFCDGKRLVRMPASQDHKRRFDGDRGPNTGGMGVFAPVELYDRCALDIEELVVEPFERALARGALNYCGIVYAGMMVTPQGDPFVLEFNARFGDPETQALLPLLASDLFEILWACTEGTLDSVEVKWEDKASCCVVAAAKDYPEKSSKGESIVLGTMPKDSFVFHAGTKLDGTKLLTNGGRVLAVTAVAPDLGMARKQAYESIERIQFSDMDYRKDIAGGAAEKCLSS